MSGPKVIRIVTREELISNCQGQLAALDKVLARWTPRVMVADVVMGGVSGVELLRRIRRQWPEIRVLLISGYWTRVLEAEAMRLGAAGFVAKPFDNAEILAEVERCGREALWAPVGFDG